MTTVADLTPAQKADLFAQVGDAMNNPGFNYDAHITANTVNGVFVPPVNNAPTTATGPTPVVSVSPSPVTSATTSTIANLSQAELTALYNQVGVGVNRTPAVDIDVDGLTTVKKLRIGIHKLSYASELPNYSGTKGEVVFNANPTLDSNIFAWQCLGGFKWKVIKAVE